MKKKRGMVINTAPLRQTGWGDGTAPFVLCDADWSLRRAKYDDGLLPEKNTPFLSLSCFPPQTSQVSPNTKSFLHLHLHPSPSHCYLENVLFGSGGSLYCPSHHHVLVLMVVVAPFFVFSVVLSLNSFFQVRVLVTVAA